MSKARVNHLNMKLYSFPMSSNARRAMLVVHHLELPVEVVVVDLVKGGHKTPDYVALNPSGKVPTLVDGDFVLTESWAIMAYLADQKPGPLYPSEPKARGHVQQWMFWAASHVMPQISALNFENMLKAFFKLGPTDPARVALAEKELRTAAAVLDAELGKHTWVAGDTLTIADFAIAAPLMATERAKLPVTDFVNLQRWFSAIKALPAWQATEPTMALPT
mgnify:CR=1 FL=1